MSRYVSRALREKVAVRAGFCCEYCRLPEVAVLIRFQVEHIISVQHGGKTTLDNLAFACPICNSHKGPNVGTVLDDEGTDFVPFFNPRKHRWDEHFEIQSGQILPKTRFGSGTVKILNFNMMERIMERLDLIEAGYYP